MIRKRPFCFVCLMILFVQMMVIVVAGKSFYTRVPATSIFSDDAEKYVELYGQVYQISNTSNTQILHLKNNSIQYQNQSYKEPKIIVYDKQFEQVKIGQVVKLHGSARRFDHAHNPGNFDPSIYYEKKRIFGMVMCEEIVRIGGKANALRQWLCELRSSWKEKLYASVGEENGAILCAILLNEKSDMEDEMKLLYQKSGISHVLAISGLHISLLGLSIYRMLRKLGGSFLLSGMGAFTLLFGYVLMIGITVSVLRAITMLLLKIGADMTGRVYDIVTAVCFAATITCLYQPRYITDAGFLLSYGAILGILFVLPAWNKLFPVRWKLVSGLFASASIQLAILPVLLYFFFEIPTYAIALNLFVIPLMSVVLMAGMCGSALLFSIPVAGNLVIYGSSLLLELVEWMSEFSTSLPGAVLVLGRPRIWQIVLYYIVLCTVILLARGKCIHRRKYALVLFVFLGTIFFVRVRQTEALCVTMLDVGQGDGLLIRGPNRMTCLVDGGSSDVKELGRQRMEPCIKCFGISQIDYAFVSHGDADHYSGVEEMLQNQRFGVRICHLVLPALYEKDEKLLQLAGLARENGTRVFVMKTGMKLREGEMELTCLQPDDSYRGEIGNASSMVLQLDYGTFSMLLTGDVEGDGERLLEKNMSPKRYTVLKVAHHGSKHSTTELFLEKTRPKIALISAGKGNRYKHPHRETIQRLKQFGCEIYSTVRSGAITIETDGNRMRITGFH